MDENKYITVDGKEFMELQGVDAPRILGVSRTTFYKDQKAEKWASRPGIGGAVIWSIPREYIERRQEEKVIRDANTQQGFSQTGQHLPDNQTPIDASGMSAISAAWQQLIDEKEKRIQQLEEALERERELTAQALAAKDQAIAAKESEVNTMRGMMLLTSGKADANPSRPPEQVEYTPVQPGRPESLWDKLNPWKK